MALNPPNRAQYVGPLDSTVPQAGSPEDLQWMRNAIARQYERQTARANKKPVVFRPVSGMPGKISPEASGIRTVRAQSSNKHFYNFAVDEETGTALPLTAEHVSDCPTCTDESYEGSWFKGEK